MATVQNQQVERPDVEHDPADIEHPTPDELWSAITDLHRRLVLVESHLDVAGMLQPRSGRPVDDALTAERALVAQVRGRRHGRHTR